MRHLTFILVLSAFSLSEGRPQWKATGIANSFNKITAFGVHNHTLFVSAPGAGLGYGIYRYAPDSADPAVEADYGIAADAKGKVVSFGSYGDYLFAGADPGLYRTQDEGAHWTKVQALGGPTYKSITFADSVLITCDELGVDRSPDFGTSWTYPARGGLSSVAALGSAVVAVGNGVLRSTDWGVTWIAVNSGLAGLKAMTTMEGEFVTCSEYGLYRSPDSGATWIQMNYAWLAHNTCLASSGPNLFVGTDDAGIFLTTDKGMSWTPVNQGLFYLNVTALSVYDTLLMAGIYTDDNNGHAYGLKRPLSEMLMKSEVQSSEHASISDRVTIYPNPAERSAVVEYSLQDETKVDLGLFDVMGREISILLSQSEQGAGLHRFELDVSHIPPGAYWVHLRTNNKERVDRIILKR